MALILSGTDGLSDVDGSAATPAIRGTDTNTGIFFPAADTIAFSEGGTEAMRIDSSGNVGIGTSSPISSANQVSLTINSASSYARLDLLSGGTQRAFFVSDANAALFGSVANIPLVFYTNSSERMRIDSSGNVGIGTTTPNIFGRGYSTMLTVNSASGPSAVQINSATGNSSWLELGVNGSRIGSIRADSSIFEIGTGTALPVAFYTNGNYRMYITSAGDVGIGTIIPNSKLDVANLGTNTSVAMRLTANDSGGNSLRTVFTQNADGSFTVNSNQGGNGSTRAIIFQQTSSERMRISNSGNVIAGTTVDSGGRLQVVSDTNRFISNANGIYRVFTHRINKTSNTTSTCAITFGNQGNQHASHIVEVLFAAAQDDANGGVGGRATYLCGSLAGVGNISEIQDIGTGTSFSASASGDVLTITATTTSSRNVVAWTVKVTSTYDAAAPTQIVVA